MTIGIDDTGKRIAPTPGANAHCQICKESIIAKCGEIYTWHWSHKSNRDCDPWKEHETEWHRRWKNKFPFEWQEIAITDDNGERHAADVKTDSGLVIEFQNSSISTSTIGIREEFYGNMIWVINAESFKKHFRLGSVVKKKVKEFESEERDPYVPLEEEYKEKIDALDKAIKKKDDQIKPLFERIKVSREQLERFNILLSDIVSFSDRMLRSWINDSYIEYELNSIISNVEAVYRKKLKSLRPSWKEIQEKVTCHQNNLTTLKNLPDKEIEGRLLKVVPFNYVTINNFRQVKPITKESFSTLFIEVKSIASELDFHRMQYTHEQYIFTLDLSVIIESIEKSIHTLNVGLKELEDYVPSIRNNVQELLTANLRSIISKCEKNILTDDEQWDRLLSEKGGLQIQKGTLEMKMADEVPIAKREVIQDIKDRKFSYMREMKGRYFFHWKHERRSWQKANESIFFDIGESYLFKKVSHNLVIKVTMEDFMKTYSSFNYRSRR
jgi:competence CoiA-like predicted nuclease